MSVGGVDALRCKFMELTAGEQDIVRAPSRCPPLIRTLRAPAVWRCSAARFMSSGVVTCWPVSAAASWRLGVSRYETGGSVVEHGPFASSDQQGAPCLLIITGSTTSGNVNPAAQ